MRWLVKFFTKSGYTEGRYCIRQAGCGLKPVERTPGVISTADLARNDTRCLYSGAMAKKQAGFSFRRSAESFQDNVQRAGPAAAASYTLIGAIILLGGIGYAVDQWRGSAPWGLFVGLVLGLIVGFYELAKVVWHR
jgi:F0F1-type ATP synthase assembly protein I